MQFLLILIIAIIIINILHIIFQILTSETGLHMPKGSVDKWDEIFCWIPVSGSTEVGGSGYLRALWYTDIWLADEICQEEASG